jgi:hypothetical protein
MSIDLFREMLPDKDEIQDEEIPLSKCTYYAFT